MGVIKYIQKKKIVTDRRKADGGYYEAECNECGGQFYPTRSNAIYCSKSCQQMAWRKKQELARANKPLAKIKNLKKTNIPTNHRFANFPDMWKYLYEAGVMVRGKVANIKSTIKYLKIGGNTTIGGKVNVRRESTRIYFMH